MEGTDPDPKEGLRLLIVDDYAPFRRLVRSLFNSSATQIEECSDPTQSVERFAAYRPDWVLMDLQMRPIDGITATRRLKERFPEARVLIVTNYQDELLREEALEAGAEGYMLKEELERVRELLNGRA